MPERSNAGYVIISAICVGDTEYVLGENPNAPARFVTWVCRNGSDYFWGRYTDDPLTALRNLLDRAGSALEVLERRRERRQAGMKIERFPLQDRLALLDTGRCAHPEYAAAIIHRFADMTLPEYFQGFEAELERLRSTLGLSREQVQSMTYKQLAKALDDRLSMTPSCGDAYLYDAAALLLPPLLDTLPEQTELEEDGAPPLGQPLLPPRSLEERLKANLPPRDSVLGDMEAGSLIRFMDELVAPCAAEFTAIYEQYFQQYGNKTVSELAADYVAMPEAERQTVLYELLIHPFASLEEHPNKRYCP